MSPLVSRRTPPADASRRPVDVGYWDGIAAEWESKEAAPTWRMVSDSVNVALASRWLEPDPSAIVLKTDLFDEVAGSGLVRWLSSSYGRVAGIDLSPAVVEIARGRLPRLQAGGADVRHLPFRTETFDAIVSNSTLDHFEREDDIRRSLVELHRVLKTGGRLLITLDNPVNPVVAIRNALPDRLRRATGLVPFAIGETCGPRRLRALLEDTGFEVSKTDAVFHSPRMLVVLAGRLLDRHGDVSARRARARFWMAFEGLARLPTRFLTGHFVAVLGWKR